MATTTPRLGLVKPDPTDLVDITVLNSNSDKIDASYVGLIVTGMVMPYAGTAAPSGWLLANGQAVSRTTYADLFAVVGTTYGGGNGSTTFNVPNLQGRIPVGKDTGTFGTLGATGGAETHTLTSAEIPGHTHTFSGTTSNNGAHTHDTGLGIVVQSGSGAGVRQTSGTGTSTSSNGDHNHTYSGTTSSSGGNGSHNNIQPYQVLNYCIKY